MICEHWTHDKTCLIPDEDRDCANEILALPEFFTDQGNAWQLVGLKSCCRIEGTSWENVMTKYHEHMEWEPYIPMKS